jgi:zinc protease
MLDRTVQPAFQKSSSFDLIQPDTITLPNGIPITIIRGGEQEVVKIEFVFDAGKWHESHSGVSYFTANLLQKGTSTKSSYEISSETDQQGVHFEVSPGYDVTSIALYGLTKNISKVFSLTREIITAPIFPAHELDQAKAIYIQGLKINLEKTSYLASRQLRTNLFGKNHPYGQDADIEDVSAIEQSWLVDFHGKHFRHFRVICSGNVTDTVVRGLSDLLSNIEISTHSAYVVNAQSDHKQNNTFLEKEGSVQSSLRLGRMAVSRKHADYPALLLLNHIFGGYFGSRLMKNIREEKGLTYGIHSSVSALQHGSFISIGTDVNKENKEIALAEIKNEMNALCNKSISLVELETARNHFIGSLQAEITTPFAHADKIKNILLFSLPADYYQSMIARIESVTQNDLMQIANVYLNPDDFITVTAG